MVICADTGMLIDLFSFTAWMFYGSAFLSLIILRFKEPFKSVKRPFKVTVPLIPSFQSGT